MLLLTSALAAPISVDLTDAPPVPVPSDVRAIAVAWEPAGTPMEVGPLSPQALPAPEALAEKAVAEAARRLDASARFDAGIAGRWTGDLAGICAGRQAVLVLNGPEVTLTTGSEAQGDVQAWWELAGRASWRLLRCDDGAVLDTLALDGPSLGSRRVAEGPSAPKAFERLPGVAGPAEALALTTGQAYARRIAPNTTRATRELFDGGATLSEAFDRVEAEDWEGAVDVWMALHQNGRPTERAQAAHNLAVASERYGDLGQAMAWCDASLELKSTAVTRAYRLSLERRARETREPAAALPATDLPPANP